MENDSHRRNVYLERAEKISGHSLCYSRSRTEMVIIENYLQQFSHLKLIWTDWSRMLVVLIPTILFIIIVDLFVKKSNWNLTICCRILLSLMPILVLLVGAWIAKRIKKNGEKTDIDETKSTASN